MRKYILGFISVFLTILILEWATARFDFEYNMFRDEFNVLSLCIDLGSWLVIFIPIYFGTKKLFVTKDN